MHCNRPWSSEPSNHFLHHDHCHCKNLMWSGFHVKLHSSGSFSLSSETPLPPTSLGSKTISCSQLSILKISNKWVALIKVLCRSPLLRELQPFKWIPPHQNLIFWPKIVKLFNFLFKKKIMWKLLPLGAPACQVNPRLTHFRDCKLIRLSSG